MQPSNNPQDYQPNEPPYQQPQSAGQQPQPGQGPAGHGTPPHLVYVSRPHNLTPQPIPPHVQQKHAESVRKYPQLNLTDGEYVISAVRRHPIGLVQIWAIVVLLVGGLGGLTVLFKQLVNDTGFADAGFSFGDLLVVLFPGLAVLFVIGGMVSTYVYVSNKFFLTNESVIQELQNSLFSRHEQTVSLMNIEDASFRQDGILASILNYGSIRLSTEGDETTYRFTYVSNPKHQIALLNNSVEDYKNGRALNDD